VVVETLLIVGGLALVLGISGWRPFRFLESRPPVEQVTQLQASLSETQAALTEAREAAQKAAQAELARKDDQIRYAQQMNEGASAALAKVPLIERRPETALAADLLNRSGFALGLAIGALPREQKAEILRIVDQALSSVQAERDQAFASLQEKELELRQVTEQRAQIARERDERTRQAALLEAERERVAAELEARTREVTGWAARTLEREQQAGSLKSSLDQIARVAFWGAIGYVFIVFVLPGLVKHMDSGKAKNFLRDVSGYATSPLLYHDAKRKIDALHHHDT
jgi:multidrug efflux pump subunit AcrA (membrane-fusion protein)